MFQRGLATTLKSKKEGGVYIIIQPLFSRNTRPHRPFDVTKKLAAALHVSGVTARWLGGRTIALGEECSGEALEMVFQQAIGLMNPNQYAVELVDKPIVLPSVRVTATINGTDPACAAEQIAQAIGGDATSRSNTIYLPAGVDERDLAHALFLAFGPAGEVSFLW